MENLIKKVEAIRNEEGLVITNQKVEKAQPPAPSDQEITNNEYEEEHEENEENDEGVTPKKARRGRKKK